MDEYGWEIKEPTYEDIIKKFMFVLDRGERDAIVGEIEKVAEYVVALERFLEDNNINFTEEDAEKIKMRYLPDIEHRKKLFMLHFVGRIIKREGR
ncbi:MAG: hypothetical protein J7J16_04775 [Deltaproteobacteria bacterium]|nr:hypothetical protein [Deltaproteobacteria bacterium]